MNFRTFAPWEHYPKNLTQREIQNPLIVIDDFFSSDSLKGHAKRLLLWRNCVVSEQSYNDDRFGPATLVYLSDVNLKLLEAMYLLFIEDQNRYGISDVTEEQLEQEKAEWRYYPKNLSVKELIEPFKAVKKIFKGIKPQQYREYLHEWLQYGLFNRADNEGLHASEVIAVYENLLKLHSAAWMIFQRDTDKTQLKKDWQKVKEEVQDQKELPPLKTLSPSPTKAEVLGLEELKKIILNLFPSIEAIIYLGSHQEPFVYYLLILIGYDEKMPEGEISNKIEDHCKYLSEIHVFVNKIGSAINGVNAGQRFWVKAISEGIINYQKEGLELPRHEPISNDILRSRTKLHWERWGIQGKEFFTGAELYRSQDNFILAAFMYHQATETILKGIIQAVLGYRVQVHNLNRSIRITLLFTDELKAVFNLDTKEGKEEFALLQSAFSYSRYKNEFNPNGKLVFNISKTIKRLIKVAEVLYSQYLQTF